MRESQIEAYLRQEIKRIGGLCIKLSPEFEAGIPDRLILVNGKALFVELKSKGKKPRKIQLHYAEKLKCVGFETKVIDSKEGVNAFVNELIKCG